MTQTDKMLYILIGACFGLSVGAIACAYALDVISKKWAVVLEKNLHTTRHLVSMAYADGLNDRPNSAPVITAGEKEEADKAYPVTYPPEMLPVSEDEAEVVIVEPRKQ